MESSALLQRATSEAISESKQIQLQLAEETSEFKSIAANALGAIAETQKLTLSAVETALSYTAQIDAIKEQLERTQKLRQQRSHLTRTIIGLLRDERAKTTQGTSHTTEHIPADQPLVAANDIVIADQVTFQDWQTHAEVFARAGAVLSVSWSENEIVIEASLRGADNNNSKRLRSFGGGNQSLAVAFMIDCMIRSKSRGEVHYCYSPTTIQLLTHLIRLTNQKYHLYFSEVQEFTWRNWHLLNSASSRIVKSEEIRRTWNGKYLFPAQTTESIKQTSNGNQGRKTTDDKACPHILIISYYMPPFSTVAMQRLGYWQKNIEEIARDMGQPIQVHFMTATGQLESDSSTISIQDLGHRVLRPSDKTRRHSPR